MSSVNPIHGLSDAHYQELTEGSAIGELRVRQRYYQSVTADALPPEFADYQRRPGLLIPIRTVNNELESYQLKPDEPRRDKKGKPIKYETAALARQVLDVPPSVLSLLANPKIPLVITEGAKKVDCGISQGIKCIIGLQGVYGWRGTNAQGGKVALPDWEHIALNKRNVLIAFDSDVMSKASVRDALERLSGFLRSKGARVSYLLMPDLSDGSKCGLDDWFAAGNTYAELQKYMEPDLPPLPGTEPAAGPRLLTRTIADVEEKQIDWLWPNWLPKGMLTLLGGYAGDGKSTLTTALAAALSTGGTLPDGAKAPQTKTMLVVTEDDISHVVKARLTVHGVDANNVEVLDGVTDGKGSTRGFSMRTDVPLLRQKVLEHGIGLVVIDPLTSVMGNGDRNSEGDVRDAFGPLLRMMEETGVAVIGIMHIGKSDGHARSFQKLMGSTAFTALARCVWMVQQLPEEFQADGEPNRKLLDVTKCNIAMAPPPLQFCRPQDAAIQFMGTSPLTFEAASAWRSKSDPQKDTPDMDKAEAWLLEKMDGKPMPAKDVETAVASEEFSLSLVKKAKLRLGMKSVRQGSEWIWMPPQDTRVA